MPQLVEYMKTTANKKYIVAISPCHLSSYMADAPNQTPQPFDNHPQTEAFKNK